MRTIGQSIAAIFVALGEATKTLPRAKTILAQSLRDGVITDPGAQRIIGACADAPDEIPSQSNNRSRPSKKLARRVCTSRGPKG